MFFNVFKPLLGDKEGFDGSQPRKIYLVPKSFDEVMDEPLRSSAIQMVEASKEVVIGLSFVTMNAIVGVHNDSSTIVKGKLYVGILEDSTTSKIAEKRRQGYGRKAYRSDKIRCSDTMSYFRKTVTQSEFTMAD